MISDEAFAKKDQVPSDLKPISETCVSAKTAPEMEEIPCRHHWRHVFWFVLLNCLQYPI